MSISVDLLRERTFKARIRLWALSRLIGFHERVAVDWIWPLKDKHGNKQNSSRIEKFRNWKRKGLWPPTEKELQKAASEGQLDTQELRQLQVGKAETEERRKRLLQVTIPLLQNMPEDEIARRALENPEVPHIEKTHVGCRLPTKYVEQLESLGGKKSTHIIKAIRLYLAVEEAEAHRKQGRHEGKP